MKCWMLFNTKFGFFVQGVSSWAAHLAGVQRVNGSLNLVIISFFQETRGRFEPRMRRMFDDPYISGCEINE